MKKVTELAGIKESDTGLAVPALWDLAADKQALQTEEPLQVGLEFKVQSSMFRVQSSEFKVRSSDFKLHQQRCRNTILCIRLYVGAMNQVILCSFVCKAAGPP